MTIDLEQFHQVFFEESLEGLDVMEQSLLEISSGGADSEAIHSIFRAAHSIKGGSGTFGFTAITDFTHVLETLLDEARDNKRELTEEAIELLLNACDCLRQMITDLQSNNPIDDTASKPLIASFEAMLRGESTVSKSEEDKEVPQPDTATTEAATGEGSDDHNDILAASFDTLLQETPANHNASATTPEGTEASEASAQCWRISFIPEPQILLTGNEPLRIFRELQGLGKLTTHADLSQLPGFDHLTPDECFIHWTLKLEGDVSKDDILEVFDWVLDECKLEITPWSDSATAAQLAPIPTPQTAAPETEGLAAEAATTPSVSSPAPTPTQEETQAEPPTKNSAPSAPPPAAPQFVSVLIRSTA